MKGRELQDGYCKKSAEVVSPLLENRLEKTARLVISVFMILIMGFLTMVSFLHTTGMDITPDVESVSYHNDNLYINILLLILVWRCAM